MDERTNDEPMMRLDSRLKKTASAMLKRFFVRDLLAPSISLGE